MHERHVQKLLLVLVKLPVKTCANRQLRYFKRQRIGCKGVGLMPENVARKLVKQDNPGERIIGRINEENRLFPRQ